SPELDLLTENGFKTFVRAVAGLLSWETLVEAGMDVHRNDKQFFIANQRLDIVDVLCNRRCVRGRATRAYKVNTMSIQPMTSEPEPATAGHSRTAPPAGHHFLRSRQKVDPVYARSDDLGALDTSPRLPKQHFSLSSQIELLSLQPHRQTSDGRGGPRHRCN